MPNGQETRAAAADEPEHLQDRGQSRPAWRIRGPDKATPIEKTNVEFEVPATKADGDRAMTRRKAKFTRSDLEREWPHHVALPAETALGLKNTELVRGVAASLSALPLPYSLRRDESDFAVFCFATPEDADGLPSASMGSSRWPQFRQSRTNHGRRGVACCRASSDGLISHCEIKCP